MPEIAIQISLNDIIDSTSSAVVAVNLDGIIVYCNRQVEKILELPASKILGSHVKNFIPTTGLLDVLKDGQSQLGCRLSLKNGTYLSNRNPIIVKGQVIGAVAVFQDVTEIQNIIDELTTKNEKISELQETLTNILELSSDGIVAVNRDYSTTMANQAFASFFNKKVDEIIGQHVKKCTAIQFFPGPWKPANQNMAI